MEDIKKGIKLMNLYNSKKVIIICAILSIAIGISCIVFSEPKTSPDYIEVIKVFCYSFALFVFGLTNYNYSIQNDYQSASLDIKEVLSNNEELSCSSKFIISSNLGKKVYTIVNIIYTNILGLIFIILFSTSKIILSTFSIGNVDNLVDTVYVLFALLGFIIL